MAITMLKALSVGQMGKLNSIRYKQKELTHHLSTLIFKALNFVKTDLLSYYMAPLNRFPDKKMNASTTNVLIESALIGGAWHSKNDVKQIYFAQKHLT